MPRTIEDLKRSGATEVPIGKHVREVLPSRERVRKARRKYLEWAKRRREVQGEIQDSYMCRFLYEGRL